MCIHIFQHLCFHVKGERTVLVNLALPLLSFPRYFFFRLFFIAEGYSLVRERGCSFSHLMHQHEENSSPEGHLILKISSTERTFNSSQFGTRPA